MRQATKGARIVATGRKKGRLTSAVTNSALTGVYVHFWTWPGTLAAPALETRRHLVEPDDLADERLRVDRPRSKEIYRALEAG